MDSGPAPRLATRTHTGQLLRDVARQLDEALAVLDGETSEPAVSARGRLEAAREALALLTLERAVPAAPPGDDPSEPTLVRRHVVDAAATAPVAARAFSRETCLLWGVPEPVVNAVIDIASELTANAVRHATAPVVLALERQGDELRISAWDDGAGRPRLLPYRPGISEHGLGLHLVVRLSREWGCSEDQAGKWVWAAVPLPSEGRARPAG